MNNDKQVIQKPYCFIYRHNEPFISDDIMLRIPFEDIRKGDKILLPNRNFEVAATDAYVTEIKRGFEGRKVDIWVVDTDRHTYEREYLEIDDEYDTENAPMDEWEIVERIDDGDCRYINVIKLGEDRYVDVISRPWDEEERLWHDDDFYCFVVDDLPEGIYSYHSNGCAIGLTTEEENSALIALVKKYIEEEGTEEEKDIMNANRGMLHDADFIPLQRD